MVTPIHGDIYRVAVLDSVQVSAGLGYFSAGWVATQSYLKRGYVDEQRYGKIRLHQAAMGIEH